MVMIFYNFTSVLKKIFLVLCFFLVSSLSYSQENDFNNEDTEEIENEDPDASGAAMPNVGIADEKPIEDVVEGSGAIRYSGVAIREKPTTNSRILRTTTQSEKVLILGENGDWLHVRMYNNREGYVHKDYVRTERIFRDESDTKHSMDKTASFEINGIIDRFNSLILQSPYAKKYQVVPQLKLLDERKINNIMTLTFLYSGVNMQGEMVPSYKKNDLQKQMKNLMELIFSRLLLTDIVIFKIVINTPIFDDLGNVTNEVNKYSELVIKNENIKLEDIRENLSLIWNHIESNMNTDELFLDFPSN